jgi:hypothetical protein
LRALAVVRGGYWPKLRAARLSVRLVVSSGRAARWFR